MDENGNSLNKTDFSNILDDFNEMVGDNIASEKLILTMVAIKSLLKLRRFDDFDIINENSDINANIISTVLIEKKWGERNEK